MTSSELVPTVTFKLLDIGICRSLYLRYCAMPNSLNEDQTAMVYAMLCLSRFAQIRADINKGTPLASGVMSREDITYYHMSCDALKRWGRPSLTSIRG